MQRRWILVSALVAALVFVALGRIATEHRGARPAGTDQADQASRNDPAGQKDQAGQKDRAGHTGQHGQAGSTTTPTPSGPPVSSTTVDPDSFFTPTRLRAGEKPPQFIIVSFDGAGSHDRWNFWRDVADRAGMRFTGFLSGVYLLDQEHATSYQAPGHRAGSSAVSFSDNGAAITTLIGDLNEAWRRGYEIGTHFNGHFCAGSGYSVGQWSRADWNNELDQFFHFTANYKQINGIPDAPDLIVPADTIKGERTPCLEGQQDQLFAALRDHQMTYDSSGNTNGIAWPKQINGVWEFPLAEVPMAGSTRGVLSMDYNFFYWQHEAKDADPATAKKDSQQVLTTYQRMFDATYHGNRAPLVLGNHFNSWNHGAYTQALATFVEDACHRPEVRCVPYRDVIRWMQAQDPAVLTRLQHLPPVDIAHP
ncbi:MAG TPA: polysaccharide deacetylase [Mycobacteriales bacterium]